MIMVNDSVKNTLDSLMKAPSVNIWIQIISDHELLEWVVSSQAFYKDVKTLEAVEWCQFNLYLDICVIYTTIWY